MQVKQFFKLGYVWPRIGSIFTSQCWGSGDNFGHLSLLGQNHGNHVISEYIRDSPSHMYTPSRAGDETLGIVRGKRCYRSVPETEGGEGAAGYEEKGRPKGRVMNGGGGDRGRGRKRDGNGRSTVATPHGNSRK